MRATQEARLLIAEVSLTAPCEVNLLRHVQASSTVTEDERDRVEHVLAMPKRGLLGRRRANILARIERRIRTEYGYSDKEAIDWDSIDWAAILKFVMAILAIFGI